MAEEELSDTFRSGSFPEGTRLGDYRLEWFIGRNSIGEMYSAVNVESNKSCSLTVLFPSVSKHAPEIAAQLLRKAQEACFFCHPNIIGIQKAFSLPGCHYVVNDYFSGESAEQLLLRGGLSESQVLNIAAQLASLLAAAEKVPGMIPDFTPDTLYIDSQGGVKIFYPGFRNFFHLLPGNVVIAERSLARFASFTAPEVLLGKSQPDIRSAMYSLGMLMCALLCSGTPYDGENICQTMAAVLSAKECSIGISAPHVSFKTISLISSLTARDPEKRPASAAVLLKELGKKTPRKGGIAWPWLILGGAVTAGLACMGGYFGCKKLFFSEENYVAKLDSFGRRSRGAVAPPVKKAAFGKPVSPRYQEPPAADSADSQNEKKESASAVAPQAKQKITSVPPRNITGTRNLYERLQLCRERLKCLENELNSNTLSPGIIALHKERIEFRKRQIKELEKYCHIVMMRKARPQAEAPALNAKIRSDIILYLKRFEKADLETIKEHVEKLRKGEALAFPIAALRDTKVDFSMQIPVPRVLLWDTGETNELSLAMLLLRGVLVPVAEGAILLEQFRAPLPTAEQITLQRWGVFAEPAVNQRALTYLAGELVNGKTTCRPEYLGASQDVNASFMMEQMLFFAGGGEGTSLRYVAADEKSSLETLRLFLQAEAPIDERDKEGRTALFQAVIHGSREKTALLLEAGANAGIRDRHGKTAFDYMPYGQLLNGIRNNDTQEISSAIAAGVDLKFIWQDGRTPLEEACVRGKKEAALLLLDNGADPYYFRQYYWPPLRSCAWGEKESVAVVKAFLDRGIDPHKGFGGCFMEMLRGELKNAKNAPGIAALLLESGKCKVTPEQLLAVCRSGKNWELFRVLVEKGPDLNKPAYDGLIRIALYSKCPLDLIKLLRQRKAPGLSRTEYSWYLDYVTPEEKKAFIDSFFKRTTRNNSTPEQEVAKKVSGVEKTHNAEQNRSGAAADKSSPPVLRKQSTAKKYSGGPGLRLPNSSWGDRLAEFIKNDQADKLESFIKLRRISPDSIVDDMTMLQLAAQNDSLAVISRLLKNDADPFKFTGKHRESAVIIAAKNGNYASFKQLAECMPPNETENFTCVKALCRKNAREAFLKVYLEKHADAIKQSDQCLLTILLEEKVQERYVMQLIRFYGELDGAKHRSVIHQAVASRYSSGLISLLLRHKASARSRARVWFRDSKTRRGRYLELTVPEVIRRMKMDGTYDQLFSQSKGR